MGKGGRLVCMHECEHFVVSTKYVLREIIQLHVFHLKSCHETVYMKILEVHCSEINIGYGCTLLYALEIQFTANVIQKHSSEASLYNTYQSI